MLFKSVLKIGFASHSWEAIRPLSGVIQEHKLEVLTCKHLFPKDSKNAGLKFEVSYVDGQLEKNEKCPVVLLLPGAPGGFKDYKEQIPALVKNGARVIAPNFPELWELLRFKSPKCKNTPENKSALIRDFLASIGVSKIDMVVTHSSAVYTGLRLYRFPENLSIKSLAMINPLGHWHTTTRPAWLYWPLCEMINYRLGYGFLQIFGYPILKIISPVSVPNIDDPLLGLASIRSFDMKEVRKGLDEVAQRKPPLLFLFSDNDRLLKKKVSHEMLDIFGSKKEDWSYYDETGKLVKKGKENDWITVLNFKKGTHYSLRKHPDLVSQAMVNFLEKVQSEQPLNRASIATADVEPSRPVAERLKPTPCFSQARQLSNQI